MPSSITHELIAGESLEGLPAKIGCAVGRAPDEYYLGAQGPDLFFFYRPAHRDNFGKFLHRNAVYRWFSALLKELPEGGRERDCCLAYALGFCSHLAADAVFHPFVYNLLKEDGDARFRHQRIENDWDVYFLRALKDEPPQYHVYAFDEEKIALEGILFPYLKSCAEAVGRTLERRPFLRMLRLFGMYLSHFHRRRRPLSALGMKDLYPRETPDPAVLGGERFSALSLGKGSDADKLFLAAVEESKRCISAFFDASTSDMVLPESLFSRSLLSAAPLPP